jgi:hypothetical protein
MADKFIWLSPDILNWRSGGQFIKGYTGDLWKRPYQIWAHAEQILSKPTDEHERTNAILALRRSIDRRVRLLNDRYSFRNLPIKDKPSDTLSLLAFIGIIRPRMLQKLIDIRNAVEHEDAQPPNEDMCQVFLEFTWYFLKSTDLIVQRIIENFLFEYKDEKHRYWVEIDIKVPDNWIPNIRGLASPEHLSFEQKDGWFLLKLEKLQSRAEAVQTLDEDEDIDLETSVENNGPKISGDMYFVGEARGTSEALIRLFKLYFEIA